VHRVKNWIRIEYPCGSTIFNQRNENRSFITPVEFIQNSGSHLNRSIAGWLLLRNVSYNSALSPSRLTTYCGGE
ncbi:MAG: hypothetical protein KDE54_38695, partial [Caldilineaceae bacterium]|nr:hypothetical protein [Caldilineaceae bacterium]